MHSMMAWTPPVYKEARILLFLECLASAAVSLHLHMLLFQQLLSILVLFFPCLCLLLHKLRCFPGYLSLWPTRHSCKECFEPFDLWNILLVEDSLCSMCLCRVLYYVDCITLYQTKPIARIETRFHFLCTQSSFLLRPLGCQSERVRTSKPSDILSSPIEGTCL
jgi:hypothetical protein